MTTLTVNFEKGTSQVFWKGTEPGQQRWWVLHDWLRKEFNYDMREGSLGGMPEVYRFGHEGRPDSFERAIFTEAWQWFAIDVLAMWRYEKLFRDLSGDPKVHILRVFNALYAGAKFLTNKAGVDSRNNYPDGKMRGGDDPRIDPFVCGGNTLAGRLHGNQVKCRAFYEQESPPPVTMELIRTDQRIIWATNIKRVKVPDSPLANASGLSYKVFKFPAYQDGTEVPYPFIIKNDLNGWNPVSDLMAYGWDEAKRPKYNPPEV